MEFLLKKTRRYTTYTSVYPPLYSCIQYNMHVKHMAHKAFDLYLIQVFKCTCKKIYLHEHSCTHPGVVDVKYKKLYVCKCWQFGIIFLFRMLLLFWTVKFALFNPQLNYENNILLKSGSILNFNPTMHMWNTL